MTRLCQGSGSIAPMRDYLAATRERVVVFDGGMGATLEQYDLTPEDYGGLAGQVPRGADPAPPRRHRGRCTSRWSRRAPRSCETDTLPGPPPEARGVGPGRAHARDQPALRRDRPQGGRRGHASSPARSARPATCPPPTTRRSGKITFRELVDGLRPSRRAGLVEGGADLHHHRDRAGHPRGQGRDLRRARGVQGARAARCRSRPASRCCPTAARCCWAPTSAPCWPRSRRCEVDAIGLNCSTGPEDMRDAIRFLGEY